MATYNKRGYKQPKEKEVNDVSEDISVLEKNSATAGVFSTLDETASKTEDFVAKNQKYIIGVVAAIAIVLVGYLAYEKFVAAPKQEEAASEMFQAQQYFQQATNGVASDSLYKLSLKGAEGKFGFLDIADKYSGTDAGNLANYYAGIAYLNTGKYTEAIEYLGKFKSDDILLSALAKGAIGDAYSQNKNPKEAFDLLSVGNKEVDKSLNFKKTAALTMVANTILNHDETYMKR